MLLLKAITMFISRSVYRYLLKVLRLPNPNLLALNVSILKTTCVMLNNKLDTNLCKMEFKVLVCTRIFIMGKNRCHNTFIICAASNNSYGLV